MRLYFMGQNVAAAVETIPMKHCSARQGVAQDVRRQGIEAGSSFGNSGLSSAQSSTCKCFAEALCLGLILRAEPSVRCFRARITAATLQVINSTVAGNVRADGKFSFDRAAKRHGWVIGK